MKKFWLILVLLFTVLLGCNAVTTVSTGATFAPTETHVWPKGSENPILGGYVIISGRGKDGFTVHSDGSQEIVRWQVGEEQFLMVADESEATEPADESVPEEPVSVTDTLTVTGTVVETVAPTLTFTLMPSLTFTLTPSSTPTNTITPSPTPSFTPSATPTPTATPTNTPYPYGLGKVNAGGEGLLEGFYFSAPEDCDRWSGNMPIVVIRPVGDKNVRRTVQVQMVNVTHVEAGLGWVIEELPPNHFDQDLEVTFDATSQVATVIVPGGSPDFFLALQNLNNCNPMGVQGRLAPNAEV